MNWAQFKDPFSHVCLADFLHCSAEDKIFKFLRVTLDHKL